MNAYQIAFSLFSMLVLPIWLMMIFAPRWPATRKIITSLWIVVPFMLAYAVLEIPNALPALPLFLRPNLPGIRALLSTESGQRWRGCTSLPPICLWGVGCIWTAGRAI